MSICVLLVLMLATFLWITYREVERTLLRAGRERAQSAAGQIADMVARPLRARMDESVRLRADPALRAYLRNPTDETREAARKALATPAGQGPRRAELWNDAGSLVLEIATPGAQDSAAGPVSFPAGARPTREGVSELRAAGNANFFDMVVEIRDDASRAAPRLGYLRRFGRITSTPGGAVKRLVGSDAVVKVGTTHGAVWTDFSTVVDPPPVDDTRSGPGERRGTDGRRWVGALAVIQGTPWAAWAGFPRAVIVAPARTFVQRMTALALLFVAVSVALVGILGMRLTRPLHALARAAEEIAAGDYTPRVGIDRRDEIGRLARAFNAMTGQIEQARQRLEARVAERTADLAAARREAERANRAKSEFLSLMSHDLRTPLNAILGFAQLLETDDLDADQAENVHQILSGGRHLLELISEVLDITRIESGQLSLSPEPVSVRDVVQRAIDLVRPLAAQRNVSLHIQSFPADDTVHADRQRLSQILLNLLSNAVKYNRPNGRVTVGGERVPPGRYRIAVTDTGAGIPESKVELLFQPFERLGAEQTAVEGTGLGLALSRALAEAMGGTLGVNSVVDRGSTFWVELAEAEPHARRVPAAGPTQAPAHAEPTRGGVILYIEDNLSNVRLMERILRRRPGVELLHAPHGNAGFARIRERRPDLVLLDLHLPDMSGEDVLRNLWADPASRHVPIVVVTADATPGLARRLKAAGATACLTKPLNIREVLQVVDSILNAHPKMGGDADSPDIAV